MPPKPWDAKDDRTFAERMSDARRRALRDKSKRVSWLAWPIDQRIAFSVVATEKHHDGRVAHLLRVQNVWAPLIVRGFYTSTPRWDIHSFVVAGTKSVIRSPITCYERAYVISKTEGMLIMYTATNAELYVVNSGQCREHTECLHRELGRVCAERDPIDPYFELLVRPTRERPHQERPASAGRPVPPPAPPSDDDDDDNDDDPDSRNEDE